MVESHTLMYAKWICHTVFILLFACNNQPTTVYDLQKAAKHDVQLDIGKTRDGDDWNYKYIKEESAKLRLEPMEAVYDSLHVRIWLGHSLAITTYIVDIKLTRNKWKAQLISNTLMNPGKRDEREQQYKKTVQHVYPLSGWKYLDRDIADITRLPHSEDSTTCNQCGGADGITYFFEVATKNKYRFYYYCNPELTCDCEPARTVLDFAATLEREFDFHYIR